MKRLLTEKQASKLLNVPDRTLAKLRKEKGTGLPYCNVGNHVRYIDEDLLTWAKAQKFKITRGPKPRRNK